MHKSDSSFESVGKSGHIPHGMDTLFKNLTHCLQVHHTFTANLMQACLSYMN